MGLQLETNSEHSFSSLLYCWSCLLFFGDAVKIRININEYVHVRLTDHGRKIHREEYEKLRAQFPSLPMYREPADTDGFSKWQLWELMSRFGEHTGIASEPCFDTDIEIWATPN